MNISPVSINHVTPQKQKISSPKADAKSVSFRSRTNAVADDKDIKWSGIIALSLGVFALAAIGMLGLRKSIERLNKYAADFADKVNDFANAGTKNAKNNVNKIVKNDNIVIDTEKLRALPKDVLHKAKEAISKAITTDEYKQVLRDFNIFKPA